MPAAAANPSRKQRRRGGLWVLLVVLLAGLLWWANTPLTDHTPTGKINNVQTSQKVLCDSVLSGNAEPTTPPPPLPAGRAFERPPCRLVHEHNVHLFELNLVLLVGATAGLLALRRHDARKARHDIPVRT